MRWFIKYTSVTGSFLLEDTFKPHVLTSAFHYKPLPAVKTSSFYFCKEASKAWVNRHLSKEYYPKGKIVRTAPCSNHRVLQIFIIVIFITQTKCVLQNSYLIRPLHIYRVLFFKWNKIFMAIPHSDIHGQFMQYVFIASQQKKISVTLVSVQF